MIDRKTNDGERLSALEKRFEKLQQALAVRQAGECVMIGLKGDALLTLGDGVLHRIEARCELTELIRLRYLDRLGVHTLTQPLGRGDEPIYRLGDRARQPVSSSNGQQQRDESHDEQNRPNTSIAGHCIGERQLQRNLHVR